MRIAVGQLWQESNTFNPVATTRVDFEQFGICRGPELVERMAHTNELGGFIQALRQWPQRPEILGLVRLPAWPSGTATAETFDWLWDELSGALERAGPVDGILLALHGSMTAAKHPDVEGEILTAVRQRIGPGVPVVATLDLHANITPAMVASADVLVLYQTMPHVDVFETGTRGARVLQRILCEGARPVTAWQPIPAVLPAERANTQSTNGFAAERRQQLIAFERHPAVLSAGVATVQPWLDIPDLTSAAIVTTDSQEELAVELAGNLALQIWNTRRDYLPELHSVEDAVQMAHQCPDGLTVLSDAADATTSGAPGDSVWVLKELLRYEWPRPVLVTVVAPEIVEQASAAGTGQTIEVQLGGVRDHRFGCRLPLRVEVERLFAAKFLLSGHIGKNMPIDMGASAVLRTGNVRVLVTSRSGPHFAPELFRSAGFEPFEASVVVAKSPCGFRAVYERHARQIFSVRAPGCAPSDFWNYPYERIPRPLWPWDEIDDWRPRPLLKRYTG